MFYCLLSKFGRRRNAKFIKFSDGAQIILEVKDNLADWLRNTIEIIQIRLTATHVESLVRKEKFNGRGANETTSKSNTEVTVVVEAADVWDILCFLYYLDILNQLLLLQRKHSKFMYAKCVEISMFYKLFGCMHACILHV